MKIAFYINSISNGGAERVIVNLANFCSRKGLKVLLITSYRSKREYQLFDKIKRISLEDEEVRQNRLKRNFYRIIKLRKILKEELPEVLISFMAEANFRSIIASLGLNTKTIISVRNDPNVEYFGFIRHLVARYLFLLSDGCVFQTPDAMSWFTNKLQNKSKIIYNPVSKIFFDTDRESRKGLIISCGRLTEQKNHMILLKAFKHINATYPWTRLEIYGEGELKDRLEKYIKNNSLEDKVHLMGVSNNMPDILKKANVFVLPSIFEGML